MDIPEGNISAKKLTAENLNIELGGGGEELPPAAVPRSEEHTSELQSQR